MGYILWERCYSEQIVVAEKPGVLVILVTGLFKPLLRHTHSLAPEKKETSQDEVTAPYLYLGVWEPLRAGKKLSVIKVSGLLNAH